MQGKYWCFTNYDLSVNYEAWGASYVIYGREICPTTKREHHQGYAEWPSNKRLNALKLIDGSIHWEKRKGSADEAIGYCMKDGAFTEIGERPVREPGKRTDISKVREMVAEGKGMGDIVDVCNSFQALRFGEKLLQYKELKRTWKPEVYWFYGPTGSGKTRRASDEAGANAWWSGRDLKWWQGYDAHEHIIIDDFRGDFCTFHELLRILDEYPYLIECKGGSRQLLAKKIWITCPYHPAAVYHKSTEEVAQLLRRITRINFLPGIWEGMEVGGNTAPSACPDRENDEF